MNRSKKISSIFLTSLFFCGSFFAFGNFISAGSADHIMISEIQIGGESVYDEFIELYNPTNLNINLENWDLKRKTKSGTESNMLNNIEGVIPAYGYFLIIPRANCGDDNNENCYQGLIIADDEYTTDSFLANDNAVLLYDSDGNLIDKVGWGEAGDFESEVININPENKQSLERRIVNNLIQDTDHNKNDFILQNNPNPQNTSSVDNNDDDDEIPPAPFAEGGDDDDDETHPNPSQEGNKTEGNKIIITEFLLDPEGSDRDNEFIEIYNNGDAEVDLSGWTLEDKTGSIKKFTISGGTKISAGKYKVFYSDETGIALNNSGDGVILRNNKGDFVNETQISGAALEERTFALDENKNWVWTKRPTPGRENVIEAEEVESNSNDGDDAPHPNPLPRGEGDNDDDEIPPAPFLKGGNDGDDFDFSDKIIISEIYPNSKGTDNRNGSYEWIELFNDSERDVNLNGWMIDDILEKGSKPYLIENEIIKAGGYKIFDAAFTKIALNNTGDEVNLLWPDGTVVDKIKYEKADEGLSYNLSNNGSWFWSLEITPAEKNIVLNLSKNNETEYSAPSRLIYTEDEYFIDEEFIGDDSAEEYVIPDYIETNLADIKYFMKYARVKIKGIVSAPPGIFSDQIFYISGSGIQVYSYEVKIPRLNIGDEIEITGRISEVGGEKRILLDNAEDIKIISHDNLIEPKIISTGNVDEIVEGYLITVEGRVARIKNDVFFLDDGSGEIKIYIKPPTRIEKPEMNIGDWMVITGQVSQTSAGYRILPRFPGDLKLSRVTGVSTAQASLGIEKTEEKNENAQNKNSLWNILFFITAALVLIDWGRMRFKNKKK